MEKYKNLIITSPFGFRENPIYKNKEFHRGLDFRPNSNLDVWSGFSCIVNRVTSAKREGNYIQLRSKLNKTVFYINIFHLKETPTWVKKGMFFRPNDIISIAGSSGDSTGIHIHYEIFTYDLNSNFIKTLKCNVNNYITNENKKRIFFDPIQLFNYCIKNKIYV